MYTPGTLVLNGAYRIEAELGHGAFGVVYRATHIGLNVPRAIKTLRHDAPGVGSTLFADYRNRFTLEARLAAGLTHANVIQVYDFHEQEGVLFCVMEYAPGGSLADLLAQKTPIAIARVVTYLHEAALGLQALHDQLDAVHRDVKPSNLLLDRQGHLKVADLGLAQVGGLSISQRSLVGSMTPPHPGTPNYTSPEHNNGAEPLAPTADVYGLGCVAFELLTGQAWKRARRKVERASDLRADVPPWLDGLVERMVCEVPGVTKRDATDAARRFVDMQGVLDKVLGAPDSVALSEAMRRAKAELCWREEALTSAGFRMRPLADALHKEAEAFYRSGLEAQEQSDYSKAIVDMTRAIELNPQNAVYFNSRGLSYHNAAYVQGPTGRYAEAIADKTRAIELDPQNAAYFNSRSLSYFNAAYAQGPTGDYAIAIADTTRAIELDPQNAAYFNSRGLSYFYAAYARNPAGDYAKAFADMTRAIELDPRNAAYFNSRGLSYLNAARIPNSAGDYAKAIADTTRAIELDPQNAAYFNNRGLSYFNAANARNPAGDYARAFADMTRAIELDPQNAAYFYNRGSSSYWFNLYEQVKSRDFGTYAVDYVKVIADMTRAIELDPQNAAYLNSRAMAYDPNKDYGKPRVDRNRALEVGSSREEYLGFLDKVRKEI